MSKVTKPTFISDSLRNILWWHLPPAHSPTTGPLQHVLFWLPQTLPPFFTNRRPLCWLAWLAKIPYPEPPTRTSPSCRTPEEPGTSRCWSACSVALVVQYERKPFASPIRLTPLRSEMVSHTYPPALPRAQCKASCGGRDTAKDCPHEYSTTQNCSYPQQGAHPIPLTFGPKPHFRG